MRYYIAFGAIGALAVVGFLYLHLSNSDVSDSNQVQWRPHSFDKYFASKIEQTLYADDGSPRISIEAEQVTHKKQKIGFLTINPIKVAELKNVVLTLYIDELTRTPDPNDESVDANQLDLQIPPIRQTLGEVIESQEILDLVNSTPDGSKGRTGIVSKFVINNCKLLLIQETNPVLSINSTRVLVDNDRIIRFQDGISISTQTGTSLFAESAEWHVDESDLFVPSSYLLRRNREALTGHKAHFTLNRDGDIEIRDPTVSGRSVSIPLISSLRMGIDKMQPFSW